MKRFLILMILFIPTFSYASYGRDITLPHFYAHTGITKPAAPNEFLKSWVMGANVGLGLSLDLSKKVELITLFNYHHLTLNKRGVEDLYDASSLAAIQGGPAAITNVQLKANFNFPNNSNPDVISYVYSAVGYSRFHQQEITIYEEDTNVSIDSRTAHIPALELGIGLHYLLEGTSLFIEFGANLGFDDPDNMVYIPVRVGVRIN